MEHGCVMFNQHMTEELSLLETKGTYAIHIGAIHLLKQVVESSNDYVLYVKLLH